MTMQCLFQLTQKLCKEAEGCSMGGPLSVALADIQAIWIKNHLVKPLKSVFYKIYVGGIYSHSSIWFLGIRIVWGQKFQAKTKRKIDENYSFLLIIFNKFLLYLTNIIFIQHVFFFKTFDLKLIFIPLSHILLLANIYNFLNSNCSDTFNSKTIKT